MNPDLYFVVPENVADADVPSGGNTYDRRVAESLTALDVSVTQVRVSLAQLGSALAALPDDALVLIDGLLAGNAPDIVVPATHRLRVAVLVHMPLSDEYGLPRDVATDLEAGERSVLRSAGTVIATSPWSARRLGPRFGRDDVRVATPGTDPAVLAPGTDGVSRLLCIAAVTPGKGLDLLVDALASVGDLTWTCDVVGSLHRAPSYVDTVRTLIDHHGLSDRIRLAGPSNDLAADYARADLLVSASRGETYGMVVAEALARGIPVLATEVGAVPETLGHAPDGTVPGLLVRPGGLGEGLRRWLTEPALRDRLRGAALARRDALTDWTATALAVADALQLRRVIA